MVGGAVPKEYSKAISEGVREAAESGVLAGYPVLDIKVTAFDGSYHDVDSSEMAFKIAGSMAFKEANRAAGPILLEPIMKVEVTTPKDYLGAINGDLNRRRGMIMSSEEVAGAAVTITANVPALGNVRVRDRHAVRYARPRDLHDGVRSLRKGAEVRRGRDRRQSSGQKAGRVSRPQHHQRSKEVMRKNGQGKIRP